MTGHEIRLAKALGRCNFLPGHPHKRFCRDMAALAEHSPDKELTARQSAYLDQMAWRYRRQMPGSLVPDGKPANLLPVRTCQHCSKIIRDGLLCSSCGVERSRRMVDPEPTQVQMFLMPKLPPVFRREVDL